MYIEEQKEFILFRVLCHPQIHLFTLINEMYYYLDRFNSLTKTTILPTNSSNSITLLELFVTEQISF